MEQDYLIAGHRIKVENEPLMHAMDRMSGFEVFKVNNKDEDTFRFVLVDSEMPAWKEILYSIDINGIINRFGTCANGYIFYSTPPEGETLELWVDNNGRIAHLKGNLDPRLLRFACWMAWRDDRTLSNGRHPHQYNCMSGQSGTLSGRKRYRKKYTYTLMA